METKIIEGIEYITHGAPSGGDYGGSGYLARVNVKVLEEMAESFPAYRDSIIRSGFSDWNLREDVRREIEAGCPAPSLIVCTGGYNSTTAYVRADCDELVEAVESLEDYPVLCDNALSEAEMEMENEAWIDYIAHDVRIEIEGLVVDDDDVEIVEDIIENMDGDDYRELFHDACEVENVYPEYENGGGVYYCGLPEIAAHMLVEITKLVEDKKLNDDLTVAGAQRRAIRDGVQGALVLEGGAS